jgi:cobalt-zinc-cadmium efflux system protein
MHHPLDCPDCRSEAIAPKGRLLGVALTLILGFAVGAYLVGRMSHSLALVAESGHMLSDAVALGLALVATWVARWPASSRAPFGYRRVEILAALVNAVGLVAIALWVGWEAIQRLRTPAADEILGLPMLVTAGIGFGINSLNAALLHNHSHSDLNLKGAFLHMVADALSSVGVVVAAIAIWTFGWNWADGTVSLLVAGLILAGAVPLVRQSLEVLLEKTPSHLDPEAIKAHLLQFEGVLRVDELRVWAIAPHQEMLAAQLRVNIPDGAGRDQLLESLKISLHETYGLHDIFLQLSAQPKPMNLSQPQTLLEVGNG